MAPWDAASLDLLEPASSAVDHHGRGEVVVDTVHGRLHRRSGSDGVGSTRHGSDALDPVGGDGDAELDESGWPTGEIRSHGGAESTSRARPMVTLAAGRRTARLAPRREPRVIDHAPDLRRPRPAHRATSCMIGSSSTSLRAGSTARG